MGHCNTKPCAFINTPWFLSHGKILWFENEKHALARWRDRLHGPWFMFCFFTMLRCCYSDSLQSCSHAVLQFMQFCEVIAVSCSFSAIITVILSLHHSILHTPYSLSSLMHLSPLSPSVPHSLVPIFRFFKNIYVIHMLKVSNQMLNKIITSFILLSNFLT